MTLGLCFWILMILWAVLGFFGLAPFTAERKYLIGGSLLMFILLFLLGWEVFGFVVHK